MASEELVRIGFIIKTHGVRGQLKISFDNNIEELSPGEALFISLKGARVPFFISEIEYIAEDEALVSFEEIESPEKAIPLAKKEVWGRPALVQEGEAEPDSKTFEGFMVTDSQGKEIGKVHNSYEMGEYTLLAVLHDEKEILIPFHPDLLIGEDIEAKKLRLKLPEGLLDL